MKYTILLITLLSVTFSSKAQSYEVKTANSADKLLGQWSPDRLRSSPYSEWFEKNYSEYRPAENELKALKENIAGVDSITVFMGTWCGDSKREIPRIIKSLESVDFDFSKLKLVCVDRTFQNYKQSPGREEAGLNIHRVPTILFHNENTELGRIVESPRKSLEQDMVDIVRNEGYIPNYEGVWKLSKLFADQGIEYIKANRPDILIKLQAVISDKYELNTYGLVLFSSFQLAEANLVYELNKALFPEEPLPYFSHGKFEAISGFTDLAKADLEKAHNLAPDDQRIKSYLDGLK